MTCCLDLLTMFSTSLRNQLLFRNLILRFCSGVIQKTHENHQQARLRRPKLVWEPPCWNLRRAESNSTTRLDNKAGNENISGTSQSKGFPNDNVLLAKMASIAKLRVRWLYCMINLSRFSAAVLSSPTLIVFGAVNAMQSKISCGQLPRARVNCVKNSRQTLRPGPWPGPGPRAISLSLLLHHGWMSGAAGVALAAIINQWMGKWMPASRLLKTVDLFI